ncbi:coatomer subunit delta, partial [Massospora cicadina]
MVVLAASICTVSGKVLLSRQFVEIPRSRVEGLIAAFPKLIGAGSQHTVIEKENIRYVYQSLGKFVSDIETLRLLGQVVSKVCHSTEEEKILEAGFELLSAFDEIVSLGYRDTVTLSQLSSIIEMESHEERIQEIISQ